MIGDKYRVVPGQDLVFMRCHCGLLLMPLRGTPCAECSSVPMAYLTRHSQPMPRDDGRTAVLASILVALVFLWLGVRIDNAPNPRTPAPQLD